MVEVSIIVPVYNVSNYINRCIDSILKQDFKKFELILINDGSTDDSLEKINKYKQDSRVRIYSQKNKGPALTRNFGIKKAKGKYIMFIDSDDFIDQNYIKNYYAEITSRDFDIVIGGYKRIVENKVKRVIRLKKEEFSKYIITGPVCRIIRKEFLIKNNIEFLDTNSSEDVYFNIMIYKQTKNIGIINDIGYNYYYNSFSLSNNMHKGFKKEIKIINLLNSINIKCYNVELNQYYIIRYIIWYLLFSGRTATSKEFIKEYQKLFSWLKKNIPNYKTNKYIRIFGPKGEKKSIGIIIFIFMKIHRFNLVNLFSKIYCIGK